MTDPKTPGEWQEAVDGAHACLVVHSAKLYGLIEGGPVINVERCVEILELGKARGVTPAPDALERFVYAMKHGKPRGRPRKNP